MKNPKVSIIIPAYNAANYIQEAVDSALAQTYKNIEVIVVDDGSTDNTKEILEPYIAARKVKYIYQANKGLAGARNTGIKNSKGEYIALLDADDVFLPKKIEKQVAYLENHPDCDICYCDLYHFWDGEPEKLFKLDYKYYSGDEVLPNLIKSDFIAPLTMVLRESVFERFGLFNEKFRRSEDLEFLVRILTTGARICFLDEILAKLRLRRTGNLQGFQSQPEVKRTTLSIFENLKSKLSPEKVRELNLEKYLAIHRLKVALAYLENGDKKNAKEYILKAYENLFWRIFASCILLFILAFPPSLLASTIRHYHLKKQRGSLLLVSP